ncbi:MAG TPA: NAD-dependent epimerase/dehydratase family protein [Anaerolineaceae bacterium]
MKIPQKVLILGGSGFVSGTLAKAALQRGSQVWTVTRGQRPLIEGVTPVIVDRHDEPSFRKIVSALGEQWDLVVDCIGFEPADAWQDLQVFQKCARQMVFISTDFVYDPAHRHFPQNEETEWYTQAGYGGKKRLCELEFLQSNSEEMTWSILRPCHIYGPGSQLGCLPMHTRDPQLIARIRAGEPIKLVGGGCFLQQPILANDLAELILNLYGNPRTASQIFCAAGPEIIESRQYYQIIADILGTTLTIEDIPVDLYRQQHPEHASYLCHRIYDLAKLKECGVPLPSTSVQSALEEHVASLITV